MFGGFRCVNNRSTKSNTPARGVTSCRDISRDDRSLTLRPKHGTCRMGSAQCGEKVPKLRSVFPPRTCLSMTPQKNLYIWKYRLLGYWLGHYLCIVCAPCSKCLHTAWPPVAPKATTTHPQTPAFTDSSHLDTDVALCGPSTKQSLAAKDKAQSQAGRMVY